MTENAKNRNMNNPHSWINYPNTNNRKCTVCGTMKRTTTVKGINKVTYEKNNIIYDEYIECIPKNKLNNF